MTDRAATVAECLAVAVATREVTARDVWQAYARVALARQLDADDLRDWREQGL